MNTIKLTYILSVLNICFSGTASIFGILAPGIYNDNNFVKTAWLGNDWVTWTIVIPAMILAMVKSNTGSIKAQLIWVGLIGYLLYNYAFYLFGASFNNLFLLYVCIFSLSIITLITGLSTFPANSILWNSKVTKWISAYLMLLSLMLCIVEVPPCIAFITEQKIPDIVVITEHSTNIVYALDLSLIVPAMTIASILLWRNNVWGIVISAIMLVKGFTYGLVLVAGTILQRRQNISDPLLPVWIIITLGGLIGLYVLLKNIKYNDNYQ